MYPPVISSVYGLKWGRIRSSVLIERLGPCP
jgi:hypothetical protein